MSDNRSNPTSLDLIKLYGSETCFSKAQNERGGSSSPGHGICSGSDVADSVDDIIVFYLKTYR
jgi:hypothetical protein